MASRIGGIAYFKIDGQQYKLRGNLKVQILTKSKEGVVGQDSVHGFKEMPLIPFIEAEVSDLGNLSWLQLQNIVGSTVMAALNNGKVYALYDAWFAGPAELDTVDGKITIKFEGKECIEQVSTTG